MACTSFRREYCTDRTPSPPLQHHRASLRILPGPSLPPSSASPSPLTILLLQCVVTWPVGSSVAVNWLGPPAGNVSVSLESNVGGPTYPIIDSIAATSQEGYCDAGYGLGVVAPGHECGRVEFVIPSGWTKMDNCAFFIPLPHFLN